ncbi:hypothetical protein CANARDRAFT_176346 [[Candida] arabinofermentans NRRL YB-2248]|uniref:Cystathionine gamma-synthase n=1 Tax=[Candida] arabinofermentans NRRL YB-2248 TaxID=983967 RepID=A0A1E4SZJ4_9ASCO|nr:hypothetical protein CANARDRAFT_176346 [[Candida] arabinofermentans NRRL YB-2248]
MTGFTTNLIHADDSTFQRTPDVVQPINVTTTFRYSSNPSELIAAKDATIDITGGNPVYSRLSHPNSSKAEAVLKEILDGEVVVYNSGLSAFFALLTHYNPKVLAIGNGYHGCHGIANIFTRLNGLKQVGLDDLDQLNEGDLLHIETPENPFGTTHDLSSYVKKAHAKGVIVSVDATFAPPPLQNPFDFDVDIVLHSGTKYFGGMSDLLAGVLVTKDINVKNALVSDRVFLGTNIANLESFLLLRSLRTFEMRITRQSKNAEKIVKYLNENIKSFGGVLTDIQHSSLQTDAYIKTQMKGGHSPVFSIDVKDELIAKSLPSKLKYFHHATSLGGVESLIEWRAMSDTTVRSTLLRVSIGIEDTEDLIEDLEQALKSFI